MPQAHAVADDDLGHGRIEAAGQFDPLCVARTASDRIASSIVVAHAEGGRLELELARLDLGEVEDVVDDRQERFGRVAGRFEVLPLLARQLGVEHEIGHADDGVHRRADFVAHVGEERALGVAGGFGRLHRLPQGGFHLLAGGDVEADAEDRRLAVVLDDGGREVGPQLRPPVS